MGSKFLKHFYGKKQLNITEFNQIIDRKALLLICSRLSKSSGDLRIAFQVLNKALTERSEEAKLPITINEVTTCYDSLFESKLIGILRKLPRSHSLVVKSIHHAFSSKEHVTSVPSEKLLEIFNDHFARNLMIPRINVAQLSEIVESLRTADIVKVLPVGKSNKRSKSVNPSVRSLMPGK